MPKSSFAGKAVGPDFKIIGKKIGAGNFGEVYLGENIHTNQRVAIKIEKQHQAKSASASVRLCHEYDMLKRIYYGYPKGHKINGIPQVHYFGKCGNSDCMVLELLGPNLEDLFELCGKCFSLKTTLMIGFQLLDRIESVHTRGLIYRDVKPENFLLGSRGSKEFNIIHLVDFGLATFFKDPSTNKHLPYKDLKTMTGTARYMSIHSHFGKSQSRRDDLESIAYVLIYFAKGRLPWQGLMSGQSIKEKYRKIRESKTKTQVADLCQGLPVQFSSFVTYVKKLSYTDTPDYEFLKDLLHSCYERSGFSYNDTNFDWSTMQFPADVQRFVKSKIKRDSQVSSFNTEASSEVFEEDQIQVAEPQNNEEVEVKENPRRRSKATTTDSNSANEECDVLGDLDQLRKRADALGQSLNNSKWNLKSISSSDIQACTFGSISDLYNGQMSNSTTDLTANRQNLAEVETTNGPNQSQGYFSSCEDFDKSVTKSKKCVQFDLEEPPVRDRKLGSSLPAATCTCDTVVRSSPSFLCCFRTKRQEPENGCPIHSDI